MRCGCNDNDHRHHADSTQTWGRGASAEKLAAPPAKTKHSPDNQHQVRHMGCHGLPGHQHYGDTLDVRRRVSGANTSRQMESIQHGSVDVGHDQADEPTQASQKTERHDEREIPRYRSTRQDGAHDKPEGVGSRRALSATMGQGETLRCSGRMPRQ